MRNVMKIRRELTTAAAAVCAIAALVGCGKKQEAAAPPPMDVLVADVVQKKVPVFQEWIGTLTGYTNAEIRPQVRGYILTKNYKEGDVVAQNALLFQIDPREFQAQLEQAQGDLAKAQATQGKSQLDVNRYTPLAAQGAVSQQELDNAVQQNQANLAAVASAKASVDQAALNLGWTKVTSPIAGVAGIAITQIGNLVDQTVVLTTVSTLDPIKVVFPVAEQGYLRYARAQAIHKETGDATEKGALELILADGMVYPHRGTISVVGREVDPRTGTITLEGLFPNTENILRPGGYAKIRAVVQDLADATVVPQAAVRNFQGTMQVAVVGANNVVEMRNVTTGPRDGLDWVITDGVQPGEKVVAQGLQKVRGGMTVAPKPYVPPAVPPTATPAPF
jgi:membrane fusion protein (multidrug efflux system)